MMCFGQKFTWKDRQKFRRKMLGYFQDATEERLAAINAAIEYPTGVGPYCSNAFIIDIAPEILA